MPSVRTTRGKLALTLACALLLLVAFEAALRVRGYAPLSELQGNEVWRFLRASDDPRLAYELIPSARGHAFGTDVSVNALGFRGPEVAVPKPEGARRIVVLGDSITFGNDLDLEATYPRRLEALLAQAGRPAEVCNLGVTGYDTLQETLTLERIGLRLEPDLVVIGFCLNDVGTVSLELTQFQRARRFDSPIFRLRVAQWLMERYENWMVLRGHHDRNGLERFLSRNRDTIEDVSGDAQLAARMQAIAASLERVRREPPGWSPVPWYTSPAHVGKLRWAFRRLAGLAREHGFQVLVLLLPCLKERPFLAAHDLAYELVAQEAREHGFGALSLAPEVRTVEPAELQVRAIDWFHFNAAGHDLVARALFDYLLSSGFATEAGSRPAAGR